MSVSCCHTGKFLAGDTILTINGEDVTQMSMKEIGAIIRSGPVTRFEMEPSSPLELPPPEDGYLFRRASTHSGGGDSSSGAPPPTAGAVVFDSSSEGEGPGSDGE